MNYDVVCFGRAGFDIFVGSRKLKNKKTSNKNHISLDFDSSYPIDQSVYALGGCGFNSAMTFARQGLKTAFISRTGRDHFANQLKQVAKHEQIDTNLLISKSEHRTDMNIHLLTGVSKEILLSYTKSFDSLVGRDINFPGLRTKLLYIAELPKDKRLLNFLLDWCKINKVVMFVNITSLQGHKLGNILNAMSVAGNVLLTKESAEAMFASDKQISITDMFEKIKSLGISRAVVYDVTSESHVLEDSNIYSFGSYKKVKPVDMTGVNDAFASGFVASYFINSNFEESMAMASANACSVLGVLGTRSGILKKPVLKKMKYKVTEV